MKSAICGLSSVDAVVSVSLYAEITCTGEQAENILYAIQPSPPFIQPHEELI